MDINCRSSCKLFLAAFLFFGFGEIDEVIAGYDTPVAALAALEEAYRNNDIETAIAVRDFVAYARQLIAELNAADEPGYEEAVLEMAATLELAYRKDFEEAGFVDMSLVSCRIIEKAEISEDTVLLTEECKFLDNGEIVMSSFYVHKSENGWRIGQIDG